MNLYKINSLFIPAEANSNNLEAFTNWRIKSSRVFTKYYALYGSVDFGNNTIYSMKNRTFDSPVTRKHQENIYYLMDLFN